MAVFPQPLRLRGPPAALAATLFLASGCVSSELVPTNMEAQIARDLPFESIKAEPEKYKGRVVVLGGKVLSAKRLKEGTQIEVLQLPLPVPSLLSLLGGSLVFPLRGSCRRPPLPCARSAKRKQVALRPAGRRVMGTGNFSL